MKTHVTRILGKLGLRDRVQIVVAAVPVRPDPARNEGRPPRVASNNPRGRRLDRFDSYPSCTPEGLQYSDAAVAHFQAGPSTLCFRGAGG